LVIGDLGHAKYLESSSGSSKSSQTFGTANYLAPEAHDLRRSNKIDIWSFGCIVYELFNFEKLFNNRHPDRLRDSIRTFNVETKLKTDKIRPLYVTVIKK
jgi:serine/threonine protein kinase